MTETQELIGYCLKCKEKRPIQDPKPEWAANGTPATRGTCSVCGTTIYLRGATAAHEHLPKPEVQTKPARRSKGKGKGRGKGKGKAAKTADAGQSRRAGKLVVVESPAKARTIGRYLGSGYNVKSSVGHVRDLLKSRLSVDVDNNFEPSYRVPNEKRPVVKELKAAAARAREIFLATDPDREGEAIAWHVMESAEMDPERTKRVVFNEITKSAVKAAFDHPRQIDMDRVDAQQARRILDRLVGYKLSPLLWRKVRPGLSAGRVQSVALRLVVEREREILSFESEEYWHIKAELSQEKYRGRKPRVSFIARLHRFKGEELSLGSEADVRPHLVALRQADWAVGEVRLGTRTRRPSAPFTTSTMQQEASRRLKFGTNKTMRVAQDLYEGIDLGDEGSTGLITYMRTDSVSVSDEAVTSARAFITAEHGGAYVPDEPPVYKTRSKTAQEAHEAIRPTDVSRTPASVKRYLSRDQARLYELIWLRFVASQMSSALYDTVSADIHVGDAKAAPAERPYLFRAAGSTLRFPGFLTLYEESKEDNGEDEDVDVPADLAQGEALDLMKLLPEQRFTQPPPRFTEASLVRQLEDNEIGRPSTYASIISVIQNRDYVTREKRRLVPTDIGFLVNDLLVEHFPDIISTDFTARMEDELDAIAEGKEAWVPVLSSFYDRFAVDLEKADQAIPKISIKKETEPVGRDCPLCGNPLVYREGRYGRFIGCSDFPTCRHTEQIIVKVGVACPLDGGDVIEKRTRKGRLFFGCANYPACEWTSWKRPLPDPCVKCGGMVLQAGQRESECTQCGNREPLPEAEAISDL